MYQLDLCFSGGATTPRPMPVPLPYMRPVPTAPMAHPVQHPGQFVRLDPDHSGVMNGARGNNSGELQKVREEFEAGKPWCFEWRR